MNTSGFKPVVYGLLLYLGLVALLPGNDRKPEPKQPAVIAKDVGDLAGIYSVSGTEASGKKYSTVATIQRRGDSYIVIWTMAEVNTVGIGLRQSDTLSVGWTQPIEGKHVRGVTVFKLELFGGNPRLTGRWVSMASAVGSETLTWLKAAGEDEE